MTQRLVHGVVSVLAPGVIPMFLTDQLASYEKALLAHLGCWIERVSEKSGRALRRWMPVERLQCAQVEKKRRRRKTVAVTTRVVYGTKEAVASALAAVGHKINTAFIERLNRTLRSHVPGLGRREDGLANWSLSGMWPIYPHRGGTLPYQLLAICHIQEYDYALRW